VVLVAEGGPGGPGGKGTRDNSGRVVYGPPGERGPDGPTGPDGPPGRISTEQVTEAKFWADAAIVMKAPITPPPISWPSWAAHRVRVGEYFYRASTPPLDPTGTPTGNLALAVNEFESALLLEPNNELAKQYRDRILTNECFGPNPHA
jgi:hypothetical protein